jgi:hypothetical protein
MSFLVVNLAFTVTRIQYRHRNAFFLGWFNLILYFPGMLFISTPFFLASFLCSSRAFEPIPQKRKKFRISDAQKKTRTEQSRAARSHTSWWRALNLMWNVNQNQLTEKHGHFSERKNFYPFSFLCTFLHYITEFPDYRFSQQWAMQGFSLPVPFMSKIASLPCILWTRNHNQYAQCNKCAILYNNLPCLYLGIVGLYNFTIFI